MVKISIVLTRESEGNSKLASVVHELSQDLLAKVGLSLQFVELPAIRYADADDTEKSRIFTEDQMKKSFDCVCLTSPEAARRYVALFPHRALPVTVVGDATGNEYLRSASDVLTCVSEGCEISFCSPKADARAFAESLPISLGKRVLLPGSALQSGDLKQILEVRGFEVTSMHTYTTIAVVTPECDQVYWIGEDMGENIEEMREDNQDTQDTSKTVEKSPKQLKKTDAVVWTFGSPSAVNAVAAWSANGLLQSHCDEVGDLSRVVCIGRTSAVACQTTFPAATVHFPESPGIRGWAQSILDTVQDILRSNSEK